MKAHVNVAQPVC